MRRPSTAVKKTIGSEAYVVIYYGANEITPAQGHALAKIGEIALESHFHKNSKRKTR